MIIELGAYCKTRLIAAAEFEVKFLQTLINSNNPHP
jgi:hypothetical protein